MNHDQRSFGKLVRSEMLTRKERRHMALEFRRQGMTFEEIGIEMGISTNSASQIVNRVLRKMAKMDAETVKVLRALELERLDAMQAQIWPEAMSGDLKAIDRILKIMERRAKLAGLDAATKHELAASTNQPFLTPEQIAEVERLEAKFLQPHEPPELESDEDEK